MRISFRSIGLWGGLVLAGTHWTGDLLAQEKPRSGPTKLLAAQTSSSEITLVWQSDPRAIEYIVYGPRKKADLGGAGVQLGRISGSGTRYVTRVVAAGAEHHYALQAVRKGGKTSERLDFNPVTPSAGEQSRPLAAPAKVQAELTGPGVITIRWDAVAGATAYSIGRSVRPNGYRPLCDLCDPKRTSYIDREAVAGQVHLYSVATVTPAGRSRATHSNEVTPTGSSGPDDIATGDSVPSTRDPAAADSNLAGNSKGAVDLKAGLKSGNAVLLTWSGLLTGHHYQIRRRATNGFSAVIAAITSSMSQYLDQLPPGISGQLGYLIEDLDGKGASEEVLLTLGSVAVDSAKGAINLKAGLESSNTVRLTWSGLLPDHSYRIRRRIGGALSSIIATITGAMSQYLDRLPPGISGQVGYIIEDLNGKGGSAEAVLSTNIASDSSKGAVDSLNKGPSNLTASVVSPGVVRLNWTLPNLAPLAGGAMPYIRVYRQVSGRVLELIAVLVPGSSTFLDHLQTAVLNVTYAIEAVYEKGSSQRATVSIDPRKGLVAGADTMPGDKGAAANVAPKGPSDVKAVLTAPSTVTLTWNPIPDATYEIRRSIGTVVGQVIATIASGTGRYVDQLPLSSSKDNTVLYRISVANDRLTPPVVVSIDPLQGTSETIENPDLDSLRSPRGRGRVP